MKTVLSLIATMSLLSACQQEKEIYYYSEGGSVSQEFELKNGQRHGRAFGYFPDGKIQSEGYFEYGMAEGPFVYYYENGNKQVEGTFRKGVQGEITKFFYENGTLSSIEYRNSEGKIFDFEAFKKNGMRDTTLESKSVLFIARKDTLEVGEEYVAEIRLGNRQYNSTKVIIGDPMDENILRYEFLPRKDSITSIVSVGNVKQGVNLIEGVALDLLVKNGEMDSVMVIPFRHSFFVK